MDIDPKDNDVFQLLKKLKEANGTYPQELLSLRRQGYLKQVAEVGAGAGIALGLRNTLKSGKGSSLPPTAGTLLEGLLVIAIVAEASAVAYFYRHKITDFLQNFSNQPRVEEVSSPPIVSSPIPGIEFTSTAGPVLTETLTQTATAISTPSLMAVQPTQQGGVQSSTGSGDGQAVSTANADNNNGNNGNHYGQTPEPERTKEPGGNSNGGGQN